MARDISRQNLTEERKEESLEKKSECKELRWSLITYTTHLWEPKIAISLDTRFSPYCVEINKLTTLQAITAMCEDSIDPNTI